MVWKYLFPGWSADKKPGIFWPVYRNGQRPDIGTPPTPLQLDGLKNRILESKTQKQRNEDEARAIFDARGGGSRREIRALARKIGNDQNKARKKQKEKQEAQQSEQES